MLHPQFNKKIIYGLFYAILGREESWTGAQPGWVLVSALLPARLALGKSLNFSGVLFLHLSNGRMGKRIFLFTLLPSSVILRFYKRFYVL